MRQRPDQPVRQECNQSPCQKRGNKCRAAEYWPSPSEYRRVRQDLFRHGRQERGRDDVTESKHPVAGNDEPVVTQSQRRGARLRNCSRLSCISKNRPAAKGDRQRGGAGHKPGLVGRPIQVQEQQAEGAGQRDAEAHTAEYHAAQTALAQRRELFENIGGRKYQDPRACDSRHPSQYQPCGGRVGQSHRAGEHNHGNQRDAQYRHRRQPDPDCRQRADEIADIVHRSQQSRQTQRQAIILLHHRQNRRECKTSDADANRQCQGAGHCEPHGGRFIHIGSSLITRPSV